MDKVCVYIVHKCNVTINVVHVPITKGTNLYIHICLFNGKNGMVPPVQMMTFYNLAPMLKRISDLRKEFPQQLQAAKWSHQLSQIKQKRENDITKKKQTKTAKQMDAKEESD